MDMHTKCRNSIYPKSTIERFFVPNDFVNFDTNFPDYNPPNYTADFIKRASWADPDVKYANLT